MSDGDDHDRAAGAGGQHERARNERAPEERASEEHAAAADGEIRRVLLVTPRLQDTRGGRAATDLALRLDRKRFAPSVCCYDGWGPLAQELERAGIDIFPLRRRAGIDLTFPVALAAEIRRRKIDVVHSLNARRAYLVGSVGGSLGNVRVSLATLRDTRLLSDSRRLAWIGRLCGEMVRAVIATSEEVKEALLRERWVPPGKTLVIPDGVNLGRFAVEGARAAARAHWRVPDDAPVIGAVLQSPDSAELELLFQAFELVRNELPRARLLVAGVDLTGVPTPEGAAAVGAYGDSPAFYAATDVLSVPFASRAVPLTLLEGLAAGVPIAASLRPGDEGRAPEGPWAFANVTRPGAKALAGGIVSLLREPDEARALTRAGRSCLEAEHSIAANVERIQELYVG